MIYQHSSLNHEAEVYRFIFQTGEELLRNKNNAVGLLEFQFLGDAANQEERLASTRRANTFSHLRLIVPSLEKAQQ